MRQNSISACKRIKLYLHFTSYAKINSKQIKDLSVKPKTETPKRKRRGRIHHIGLAMISWI